MKFLYKIYSGYDGFTPSAISDRTVADGKRLVLGWQKYIDSVSRNDECWIYFHGPHRFQYGVYVKGSIHKIDRVAKQVVLTIKQHSAATPLTDSDTSARVADIVSTQGRQVFAWPETAEIAQQCSLAACADRLCGTCDKWEEYSIINPDHLNAPAGLPVPADHFIPAYWTIPSRCFLWREGLQPTLPVRRLTHMFNDFKVGEKTYTYPLALGMYRAVCAHTDTIFDAIIPIPLSPDKIAAGELHRTLRLAREFGRLSGYPVREILSLDRPISKRSMMAAGLTKARFESRYLHYLRAQENVVRAKCILLTDDVCTHGSTMKQACRKLIAANPDVEIWLSTAGQMVVKAAVADVSGCAT